MGQKHAAVVLRSLGNGGVEAHAVAVSKYLIESGWQVTVVGLCESQISSAFSEIDAKIICLPDKVQQSFLSIFNVFRLRKILRKIEPDIVHLHGVRPIFLGGLATCFRKRPGVVCTMHGSYKLMALRADGSAVKAKLLASHFMHVIGLILSDRYITVSNQLKTEVIGLSTSYLGAYFSKKLSDKCISIYNGIGSEFFNRTPGEKRRSADSLSVGTVARMEPKKGVSLLISAIKKAKDRGFDVKLFLVGEGYCTEEYKNLCREKGLWDDVIFLGYQKDVIKFLDQIDIFVLPSFSEGMPLVILEAMARCVPVIATEVGGIPEIIKDSKTGLLVRPGQVDELSQAIEKLADSAEVRYKLAKNAYEYVSVHHTEKAMFKKITGVYDEVLKPGPI